VLAVPLLVVLGLLGVRLTVARFRPHRAPDRLRPASPDARAGARADARAGAREQARAGAVLDPARRRTAAVHRAGLAIGLVLGVALTRWDPFGRGPLLAAAAAALAVLLSVAAGQALPHPVTGPGRTGPPGPRRAGDHLPFPLTPAVAVATAGLVTLLVACSRAGAPDGLGRPGRALVATSLDRAAGRTCTSVTAPWPGTFWTLPVAALLVAGLAAAGLALRAVALRPRLDGTGTPEGDDALRRRSAGAVVAAVGILVTVPALGIEVLAAAALSTATCGPAWWRALGAALYLAAIPTAALLLWCLGPVLAPAVRLARSTARR